MPENIVLMSASILPVVFFTVVAVVLVGIIWYVISSYHKEKKYRERFAEWVLKNNYEPFASNNRLAESSFNVGNVSSGFKGQFVNSKNVFTLGLQTETRGSGKNKRTYKRTIICVDIPDTQLQMIINSKINNDASSGGNIQRYTKEQCYQLEGDFGVFFELFMPTSTQSETLSMLTPDSMLYILVNFADFDMEITGNKLYLYTYKHLKIDDFQPLLPKVDKLLEETKLRSSDVRVENITNALVARTATSSETNYRPLKKNFQILGILVFVGFFVIQFIRHPLVNLVVTLLFAFSFGKIALDSITDFRLKQKYKKIIGQYKT